MKPLQLWAQDLAIKILEGQLRSTQKGEAEFRLSTLLKQAVEERIKEEFENKKA